MNSSIIIADAGPLIAFGRINLLSVLHKTLGSMIIPKSVANECTRETSRPGASAIQEAIHKKIVQVNLDPKGEQLTQLLAILGPGESAAIALAIELRTGLLIDEKLGRNIATQLNIKIIGTAGALLLAKQRKIIKAVLPIIHQLKITGYHLSDTLIIEIAKLAHEK